MKCFLLLVQEGKVRIPAPVWEVVARAGAGAAPAPPPRLSTVLHGRCFAPKLLSDMSCSLVLISSNLWHYKFQQHSWPQLLPCYLLALRKARTELCSPKTHSLASNIESLLDLSIYVTQQSFDEEYTHQAMLPKVNPDIVFQGCFDHLHGTSVIEPVTTSIVP